MELDTPGAFIFPDTDDPSAAVLLLSRFIAASVSSPRGGEGDIAIAIFQA